MIWKKNVLKNYGNLFNITMKLDNYGEGKKGGQTIRTNLIRLNECQPNVKKIFIPYTPYFEGVYIIKNNRQNKGAKYKE